jgi:hypothetical protein
MQQRRDVLDGDNTRVVEKLDGSHRLAVKPAEIIAPGCARSTPRAS